MLDKRDRSPNSVSKLHVNLLYAARLQTHPARFLDLEMEKNRSASSQSLPAPLKGSDSWQGLPGLMSFSKNGTSWKEESWKMPGLCHGPRPMPLPVWALGISLLTIGSLRDTKSSCGSDQWLARVACRTAPVTPQVLAVDSTRPQAQAFTTDSQTLSSFTCVSTSPCGSPSLQPLQVERGTTSREHPGDPSLVEACRGPLGALDLQSCTVLGLRSAPQPATQVLQQLALI